MKKKAKIVTNLVTRFSLLFFASLIAVVITISFAYYHSILREKNHVLQQKLDLTTAELSNSYEKIASLHSTLYNDATLRSCLQWYQNGTAAAEDVSSSMELPLSAYWASSNESTAIYAFAPDGSLLARASANLHNPPPDFEEAVSDFLESRAYRKLVVLSSGEMVYLGSALSQDFQCIGVYAIFVNTNRLFFTFQNEARRNFTAVYIYDGEELIFRTGSLEPQAAQNPAQYLRFQQLCPAYTEWQIVAVSDLGLLRQEMLPLLFNLVLIILLAALCIVAISYGIAKNISAPLRDVIQSMKALEQGSFPPPLFSRTRDETNDLVQGYNHMVVTLKKLKEDILFEQQERRRMETERIQTQLALLQSQINPHFIHNTLNTLNYMALEAGNMELSSTIVSFNALLRASINTSSDYTTVADEVKYVKDYMNIQAKRYADREIRCKYTILDAEDVLLPRLILQPLVENSLFHGILPMTSGLGKIRIHCSVIKQTLHVFIVDNGVGIPDDKLELLNKGSLPSSNSYNHIGVNNVRERLKLLYGEDTFFTIISQENQGTTIYFSIPART